MYSKCFMVSIGKGNVWLYTESKRDDPRLFLKNETINEKGKLRK